MPDDLNWARSIDELLARADAPDAPDAALLAAIEQEVAPSDEAVVVYTSGSTAQPKAVVHRQWTLARHPPELARNFMLKSSDRMMPLLPAFWLAGMSMALQVLSVGATLVYPESPDTDVVLDTIARFNVNRVNAWGAASEDCAMQRSRAASISAPSATSAGFATRTASRCRTRSACSA